MKAPYSSTFRLYFAGSLYEAKYFPKLKHSCPIRIFSKHEIPDTQHQLVKKYKKSTWKMEEAFFCGWHNSCLLYTLSSHFSTNSIAHTKCRILQFYHFSSNSYPQNQLNSHEQGGDNRLIAGSKNFYFFKATLISSQVYGHPVLWKSIITHWARLPPCVKDAHTSINLMSLD